MEKAKNEIPKEYWNKTPLILKATAGLRLLPTHKAENLLNSVRELFKSTPFLTNDNSVEIMDGTDEGIFSWFTVNFLLGTNTINYLIKFTLLYDFRENKRTSIENGCCFRFRRRIDASNIFCVDAS